MTEDKLIVSGLELWIKVGCTEEERAFPQKIEMDVMLFLPLADAGWGDRLSSTVDYAAMCALLKETLEPHSFRLIEAVAERAAEKALATYKIDAVRVVAKKRALPGVAYAAVDIVRPNKK